MFQSFLLASVHFPSLRHSQPPFDSNDALHSSPGHPSFLHFFLSVSVYFDLFSLFATQKFPIIYFQFSSQIFLPPPIYPLETPSLPFSCFTQVFFLKIIISFFFFSYLLFYSIYFDFLIFFQQRKVTFPYILISRNMNCKLSSGDFKYHFPRHLPHLSNHQNHQ